MMSDKRMHHTRDGKVLTDEEYAMHRRSQKRNSAHNYRKRKLEQHRREIEERDGDIVKLKVFISEQDKKIEELQRQLKENNSLKLENEKLITRMSTAK